MYRQLKSTIYESLEPHPVSDGAGRFFDIFIMALIVANVFVVVLESVDGIALQYASFFIAFDLFSVTVFVIEYVLRLWTCTANPAFRGAVVGRLRYAATPLALVDLLAILPFLIPMIIPLDLRFIRAIRLMRVFGILKMGRYSYASDMLVRAINREKEVIAIIFCSLLILLVFASSLMYYAEYEAQPEAFSSIPAAMWWAVATLTTVGYGDVYPITPLGKLLGGVIALIGIGMFALPAGVFTSAFMEEVQKRRSGCEEGPAVRTPEEIADLLERFSSLKQAGSISEEEFLAQKRRILGK